MLDQKDDDKDDYDRKTPQHYEDIAGVCPILTKVVDDLASHSRPARPLAYTWVVTLNLETIGLALSQIIQNIASDIHLFLGITFTECFALRYVF